MSTSHCPSCHQSPLTEVIHLEGIPVFQNKVYTDPDRARAAVRGSVRLLACDGCGYVFNGDFDATLMAYDADYQNEQSHSAVFDQHLNAVVDLLFQRGLCAGRVVEIGCGKGAFLSRLWDRGVDALGFDTAYEGDDPRVRREYFSARHRDLAINTLILRHTLEHIADPLAFLRTLTAHCAPDTDLYIEVPDLDWIIGHQAFWDVFYEHVNYFSPRSLGALFRQAEGGLLFGDQYQYLIAKVGDLLPEARRSGGQSARLSTLEQTRARWTEFVRQHPGLVLWGAGAKGATFANLTDARGEHIAAVVDINPRKCGRFVAGTGHPIVAPADLPAGTRDILIMNGNYRAEIERQMAGRDLRFHVLGED